MITKAEPGHLSFGVCPALRSTRVCDRAGDLPLSARDPLQRHLRRSNPLTLLARRNFRNSLNCHPSRSCDLCICTHSSSHLLTSVDYALCASCQRTSKFGFLVLKAEIDFARMARVGSDDLVFYDVFDVTGPVAAGGFLRGGDPEFGDLSVPRAHIL